MTAKAAATLCFCISASVLHSGCGRYADFTLPVLPDAANAAPPKLRFEPKPVLSGSVDVLNPSVVKFRGAYYNIYSRFDGRSWRTAVATSEDGLQWKKLGDALVPNDYIAANGSALVVKGELLYWYQAGGRESPRIRLARSVDGRAWRKDPQPVLDLGPYGSWDERAIADPYVVEKSGWLYLYYLGQNRAPQQQLGLARSRDGVRWEKLRQNPVVAIPLPGAGDPDENGLGEPAVWERGGAYWMLYTGRDAKENRSLILMRSGDGVHWDRIGQPLRGAEAWNSKVLCDPTVLGNRFWFGGGDVASPDENLHGQIGTGTIE